MTHLGLGWALLEMGRLKEAEAELSLSLELSETEAAMGSVVRLMAAVAQEGGDFSRAKELFAEAHVLHEGNPSDQAVTLITYAIATVEWGEAENGLALLEKIVRPCLQECRIQIALVFLKLMLGNKEEAATEYLSLIHI